MRRVIFAVALAVSCGGDDRTSQADDTFVGNDVSERVDEQRL